MTKTLWADVQSIPVCPTVDHECFTEGEKRPFIHIFSHPLRFITCEAIMYLIIFL